MDIIQLYFRYHGQKEKKSAIALCAEVCLRVLGLGVVVSWNLVISFRGSQDPPPAMEQDPRSVEHSTQDATFPALKPLESAGLCPRRPKTSLDVPKTPPRRPQDLPRAAQERPRAPQDALGPLKWSQVGANIELRWVLMLKTVTTPKLLKNHYGFKGITQFRGTKTGTIFPLFSCAMLEAALKRTWTLPKRSWDAPRTLQDAPGRLLDSVWGVTWGLLGPSWAPRRPQDATKSRPKQLPRRTWEPEPAQTPKIARK